MERKLNLTWYIYDNRADLEYRYCHNCGRKVEFKDSLKRRQNANGKNIYYFAIYKCPEGHTWNKQIAVFKTFPGLQNTFEDYACAESIYEELNISVLKKEEINQVEILLDEFQQKIRLDKFLSSKITDMSRTEIVKQIDKGFIKVNGNMVKHNIILKQKDVINIYLK